MGFDGKIGIGLSALHLEYFILSNFFKLAEELGARRSGLELQMDTF